ncbi:hypothetical protein [Nonomuraea salmonea]|uniref:hypothetical protein n=1 Tax=Nonomuraea salmonea TaxID=46181 RepID=UPI002FE6FE33
MGLPEVERPVYWRPLLARSSWGLLLITRGRRDDPPALPERGPSMRLSAEWTRRTGGDLTPQQLLHERISQHLRAHAAEQGQLDVPYAAAVAADAAVSALTECGVDVAALTIQDDTTMKEAGQ